VSVECPAFKRQASNIECCTSNVECHTVWQDASCVRCDERIVRVQLNDSSTGELSSQQAKAFVHQYRSPSQKRSLTLLYASGCDAWLLHGGVEEGVHGSVEGSPIVAESLLLTEGSHGEQASSSLEAAGVVLQ
jgi:hypothetical protein